MNPKYILCVFLCCLFVGCESKEPILVHVVSGVAAIASGVVVTLLASYGVISYESEECCTKTWINYNATELSLNLQDQLYGQHLALKAVVRHVNAHMSNESPAKALALSFHGGPGTGKNLVSAIIANNTYREGIHSQFVHMLVSTKDFPHQDNLKVHSYKDSIRYMIESSVQKCERSMFIFDEIDKMPAGLIDTIKPYLDYYENLNGINYRKAIFIFLSNTGGTEIAKITFDVYQAKKARETIKLKDIEQLVANSAAKSKTSGFFDSDLLLSHMISAYIPFLPLERKHVRQCIKNYIMQSKYYDTCALIEEEKLIEIEEELHYFPDKEQVFSLTGCKRVKEKTDFVMGDN